jgi:hypothetical protein
MGDNPLFLKNSSMPEIIECPKCQSHMVRIDGQTYQCLNGDCDYDEQYKFLERKNLIVEVEK